MGKNFFQIRRF